MVAVGYADGADSNDGADGHGGAYQGERAGNAEGRGVEDGGHGAAATDIGPAADESGGVACLGGVARMAAPWREEWCFAEDFAVAADKRGGDTRRT